jgi:hypothetical protein
MAGRAIAHATATISSTAKALTDSPFSITQANVDAAAFVRISCDTQPARYTYDGTVPTASVGHILPVNTTIEIAGANNIRNLQFIRQGGSDATVSVTLESN